MRSTTKQKNDLLYLNQVTVSVTDIPRAFEFYRQLGLHPIVKSEHYARFVAPGNEVTFSLHVADRVESTTTIYFEVSDVDRFVEDRESEGFEFHQQPVDQRWGWREASLDDPDGNRVCVYHAGSVRLNPDWRLESGKDKHWLTEGFFRQWLGDYKKAWEERNPGAAAELFSASALYYETPFDPPAEGREAILEYWKAVPASQKNIRFDFEILHTRDNTGICRWMADFERTESGRQVQLDGIFEVSFEPTGHCTVFREWWHRIER